MLFGRLTTIIVVDLTHIHVFILRNLTHPAQMLWPKGLGFLLHIQEVLGSHLTQTAAIVTEVFVVFSQSF
jgi:hypothetical protein